MKRYLSLIKRYIFTLLLLLSLICPREAVSAQDHTSSQREAVSAQGSASISLPDAGFPPVMTRLMNGCVTLIHGVRDNNTVEVGTAVDLLDPEIEIDEIPLNLALLKVAPVDTAANLPIRDCFEFSKEYGQAWIDTEGEGPFLETPTTLRAIPSLSSCKIHTLRLAAGATASYDIRQKGDCRWFVVYEPNTEIDIDLTSSNLKIAPEKYPDLNLILASWTMPTRDYVRITLTNSSTIPSTILIASN